MRVLIVDDDAGMCEMFRSIMGGVISHLVETGKLSDAMNICVGDTFDVILLDLTLIDATKEETLDKIPEMKRMSGASMVVVTGALQPTVADEAIRKGADFVVRKGTAFSSLKKALLLAVHSAVVKNPRKHPGDDYMAHVALLERLVHAA